jgi:hypothetical protein
MSTILIAWELGSGLGHVGPLRAIGGELTRRGHTVAIAAPNTELCRQAFAGTGVETLTAPVLPLSDKRLKIPSTYSDVLYDCGYSNGQNVTAAAGEWLKLFDVFAPDLLLADHSPTALLAAQMRDFAVATVGTGFVCPPDVTPLPSLRQAIPAPHWATDVEKTVLDSMNAALAALDGAPLARVTEIFGQARSQYLLTHNALDHYGSWRSLDSREAVYWPPIGVMPGRVCQWPTGPAILAGPRLFVYLRDNHSLVPLLKGLAYKRYPTICYGPRLDDEIAASFDGSSVCVSKTPVDLKPICNECDVAVLHGGHGTVCEFLQAGAPMLLLPLMLEQEITAFKLTELQVGKQASLGDSGAIGAALEQLLEDRSYQERARSLSNQSLAPDEPATIVRLVDDMHELLPR